MNARTVARELGLDDGGPAYPEMGITWGGMTLRDHIATAAMQGILSNPNLANPSYDVIAQDAYKYAKAMLKERDK